jgi:low affinity Fe/Cu permease
MPAPRNHCKNHNGKNHNGAWFDHLARGIAWVMGRPATFFVSIGLILVWAATGWFFDFDDTWQLVINTGTTIVTFLMVFLIQNTQNRDTAAVHLKLDELIRAIKGARNSTILLEDADEEELMRAHEEYAALAEKAEEELGERGVEVPDAPEGAEESAGAKPR